MIVNQPPPAAKVVKREPPSRTLAYEQAIAGAPGENETDASAKAEAEEKEPAAKTEPAAPAKTPKTPESADKQAVPDLPEIAQAAPATQAEPNESAPPRVAAVPPQSVPQNHQTWAPPDEGMGNESYDQGTGQWGGQNTDQWGGQGTDQWGGQGADQWGNNQGHDQGYDQGYDPGYDQDIGGYDRPDDQWGDQGYDQGNNQWANAPQRDRWGNPVPDQWGNQPPPPGQWTPPGAQPGQPQQPGQWADQHTESGEQWVQVVLSGAEMRSAASDTAPSLFAFPYGRSLRVISVHEGWAQVTDPQSAATGWMKVQSLAPTGAPGQGYDQQQQYDAYYQEPPRERRGLFRGGFADMINRAFGGGN